MHHAFRILDLEVRPDLNRVVCDDRTITVEPKVMGVLVRLAQTPGEVVSREDLNREVWGGAFVTDDVLTRSVAEIRRLFGDDPRQPQVVETIPKRGYRLIARVEPNGSVDASGVQRAAENPRPGRPLPIAEQEGEGASPPAPAPRRPASARVLLTVGLVAVGGAVALVAAGMRHLATPRSTIRTIPLTSDPGNEFGPAVSPDGYRVAFVRSGTGGNDDIFVRLVNAETTLPLTHDPAPDRHPAWSPDGTRVAFIREGQEFCDIFIVPALGGPERHIAPCGLDFHGLAWTPDGRELAFAAREGHGPWRLRLAAVDGSGSRDLPAPPDEYLGDHSPAISPNGELVAFVRSYAPRTGDAFVRRLDGSGEARRLTFDNRSIAGLDWWHDGQSLVFSSDRSGAHSLWRLPLSGGEPQWFAGGGVKLKHPSAARQRPAVVYEVWHYETNVWGVELVEGGAAHPLVTSTQWDMLPRLSPDGSRLAFVSTRSGHPELWVSDAGGGAPVRITSLGGPDLGQPSWSPDARRIVFEARPEGAADLYVVDVRSGETRRLTSYPGDEVAPSWSSDGRLVYFSSRRSGSWEVWALPAAGGAPLQITSDGGLRARESPDGRFLYYAKSDRPGLYRRRAGGHEQHEVLVWPSLPLDAWGDWELTRDGIFLAEVGTSGDVRVLRFDLAQDPAAVVASLGPDFVGPGLSVSSDGRRLVYTRADREDADIMLMETDVGS